MPKFLRVCSALFSLLALSSCASVSVDKVTRMSKPSAPERILVQEFDLPLDVMRVDRSRRSLQKFRTAFTKQLATAIILRVDKRLDLPSTAVGDEKPSRQAAWLVTGRFLTVKQGSRALRAVIGLGAGGTKVETLVTVYDLSTTPPRPFLKFVTTGGSNAQPGAAVGLIMPNYWLLAADVVGKIGPGLNLDVVRTSREIVAVLSESLAQADYSHEENALRAKQLGKWP